MGRRRPLSQLSRPFRYDSFFFLVLGPLIIIRCGFFSHLIISYSFYVVLLSAIFEKKQKVDAGLFVFFWPIFPSFSAVLIQFRFLSLEPRLLAGKLGKTR